MVAILGFLHNKLTSLCIKCEHSRFGKQLYAFVRLTCIPILCASFQNLNLIIYFERLTTDSFLFYFEFVAV